jgi:glyoxylase-like metal-dependent hydrolase (beta-lactamase superfamily II)
MIEVAPEVWLLQSFPPYTVNVYLVQDVLIDAGFRFARLPIIRQLGRRKLRAVALTHCHPDHQGAADALARRYRVPLYCPAGDAASQAGRAPWPLPRRWVRVLSEFLGGPRRRVDRILHEGDELAGLRVIHAPGHTPGHIMFFRESDRLVIAGDVLANMNMFSLKAKLREPPPFFSVDPQQNRRSARKLVDLQPRLVLFGHGPPLTDIDRLRSFVDWLEATNPPVGRARW